MSHFVRDFSTNTATVLTKKNCVTYGGPTAFHCILQKVFLHNKYAIIYFTRFH